MKILKQILKALLEAILATTRNRTYALLFILSTVGGAVHAANLLDKLEKVESRGNAKAVGDGGKAVGCLQIHKVVVSDVNRIYGKNYSSKDRTSSAKSREIASLYLKHYGSRYEKKTGRKATDQVLARIWNGGPDGWKKRATLKYWKKVQVSK